MINGTKTLWSWQGAAGVRAPGVQSCASSSNHPFKAPSQPPGPGGWQGRYFFFSRPPRGFMPVSWTHTGAALVRAALSSGASPPHAGGDPVPTQHASIIGAVLPSPKRKCTTKASYQGLGFQNFGDVPRRQRRKIIPGVSSVRGDKVVPVGVPTRLPGELSVGDLGGALLASKNMWGAALRRGPGGVPIATAALQFRNAGPCCWHAPASFFPLQATSRRFR